jgi:hypothetical protein
MQVRIADCFPEMQDSSLQQGPTAQEIMVHVLPAVRFDLFKALTICFGRLLGRLARANLSHIYPRQLRTLILEFVQAFKDEVTRDPPITSWEFIDVVYPADPAEGLV